MQSRSEARPHLVRASQKHPKASQQQAGSVSTQRMLEHCRIYTALYKEKLAQNSYGSATFNGFAKKEKKRQYDPLSRNTPAPVGRIGARARSQIPAPCLEYVWRFGAVGGKAVNQPDAFPEKALAPAARDACDKLCFRDQLCFRDKLYFRCRTKFRSSDVNIDGNSSHH
jgi:hypothetical protein